jgi:23S rRNA (cytidine1920-2'-O)/16S rRNA (cytidine1409-2'-O)-methyltransferase
VTGKEKIAKRRLDQLLVERGLAESRERAQAVILAGAVRVEGERADKAGARFPADTRIELVGEPLRYASRGGLKLEGALEDFAIDPAGKICLDVGSSTGGFTDCLLQRGAARVYAVDVTPRQMAWKLQRDPRVVLLERNARWLRPEDVGEAADLVVADVSFISLTKVLPALVSLVRPGGDFLLLVKPQFELERGEVGRGGIVRAPELHERAVERVRAAAQALGLRPAGVRPSRLAGAGGNREFFLHAKREEK